MSARTRTPRPLFRRAGSAAAALLLAAGGLLLTAAPASAHDELIASDPAAGSTLTAAPEQLVLTFSAEISTEEGATALEVTDAAGTSLADGDFVVDSTTVTQPLSPEASGAVTVLWKVVSSDGHPISGEIDFTVTPAAAPTETPAASPTATATATPSATADPEPSATATPIAVSDDDQSDAGALPWIIGGLIVAAVIAAVAYLVVSRSRRQKEQRQLDEARGLVPPADAGTEHPSER